LAAITRREVAAGRMSPDDEVHKMSVAVEAVRKPVPVPASTVWTLNALVILVLVAAAALIVFVIDYAVNAYLR
jgi:hypothetical protein